VRPSGAYSSVSEFASSTVVREALNARDVFIVHDIRMDPRIQQAASVLLSGVRSVICVPLLGRIGPIGVLYAAKASASNSLRRRWPSTPRRLRARPPRTLETAQLYDDRQRHFRAHVGGVFAKALEARDPYTAANSERDGVSLVLAT